MNIHSEVVSAIEAVESGGGGGVLPTLYLICEWRYARSPFALRQWLAMFRELEPLAQYQLYLEARDRRGTWRDVFGDEDGHRSELLSLIGVIVLVSLGTFHESPTAAAEAVQDALSAIGK